MAYYVLEKGMNAGAVFNAANEVAVECFLRGDIAFNDIFSVVENVLYGESFYPVSSVEDVVETIDNTKQKTYEMIERRVTR
jgi:1-deoxy-D-xylulose-5-phosphate reductoisomerase